MQELGHNLGPYGKVALEKMRVGTTCGGFLWISVTFGEERKEALVFLIICWGVWLGRASAI